MQNSDIREIGECIEKFYNLAKKMWPFELKDWKIPTLSFDLSGMTAGLAYFLRNHIKINPVLFKENKEQFFSCTIPHEVAHLVAFIVYKDRGHGAYWKSVMNRFGCDNSRCHSYDVSSVKRSYTTKRFIYKCGCENSYPITKALHEKISRLGGTCKKCNSPALFTGKIFLTKT